MKNVDFPCSAAVWLIWRGQSQTTPPRVIEYPTKVVEFPSSFHILRVSWDYRNAVPPGHVHQCTRAHISQRSIFGICRWKGLIIYCREFAQCRHIRRIRWFARWDVTFFFWRGRNDPSHPIELSWNDTGQKSAGTADLRMNVVQHFLKQLNESWRWSHSRQNQPSFLGKTLRRPIPGHIFGKKDIQSSFVYGFVQQ